ncbi:MAG: helix-hairpin-helix domain-containing protein [Planctomycetota bacterium]
MRKAPDNEHVASLLEDMADLLEAQDGDVYRVRAYRRAAGTVRAESRPLARILEEEGRGGLERLPAIGKGIASAIEELVHTGRLGLFERLKGQISPEDLFTTVPGIGEELAHRIHEALGIETLEELELAAHDGRLQTVPGMGPRRARAVREILAAVLSRSARRRSRRIGGGSHPPEEPDVATLLDVDAEYRRRAEAGELRTIAPRRFNPAGEAWLPVLHTTRGPWAFTALFSNTARAHQARATHDWVVLYFERDGEEGQCTVVTETRGPQAGQRVVRGRERAGPPLAG